ncbi:reverse transcriptase domain-containing protein [Tanacetum coccineum]
MSSSWFLGITSNDNDTNDQDALDSAAVVAFFDKMPVMDLAINESKSKVRYSRRSGKTLEGPLTPLVPTPVVSIPSKEPEQNPETSTEKVQNPNLENTAQVPPPEEEDSIFTWNSKNQRKKNDNVDTQNLNSPRLIRINLNFLPRGERMKVRERTINPSFSCQHSRFLKGCLQTTRLEMDYKMSSLKCRSSTNLVKLVLRNKRNSRNAIHNQLDRTSALADSRANINLLPHSIYKQLGLGALTPTRMTLELANRSITHPMGIAEDVVVRVDGFTFLADFVVVNFEPDPRVPIILGRHFIRTAKAPIDLYEETLTLRSKERRKNLFFADELAPLDSLPPGNDDSTLKKDLHEENFQVYSNPLFEFDDNFKSSNVNPLFEENDKDVEIKSFSFPTLTSPEESELILEEIKEKDSISPGIDLTLPPTLEVSSSNPTSPTLTRETVCSWNTPMFFSLVRFVWKMMKRNAIRKKIICLLATYYIKNQNLFLVSSSKLIEDMKIERAKFKDVPINTIVMPTKIHRLIIH